MKEAKYHIENNSVQETLIIPLFGRKVCSEHFPDLFRDEEAERICAGLDYDFAAKQKKMESKMGLFGALEVAQRQYDLAWEASDYLKVHPNAAVVNLGCGLDDTFRKVDNGKCLGFNIDKQDEKFFFSAPKEVQALIRPRPEELFPGAGKIGWALFIISLIMASGVVVISIWDGLRNDFTFGQFFLRFFIITTVYKLCDMILVDYFLLLKFGFFQYYYPEAGNVMENRKYGFNIKSQLLKLLVIFPAISALLSWICSMF